MPAWILTVVCVWVGINPALRLFVYPALSLKSFLTALDFISFGLLTFEVSSLWALYGFPSMRWPQGFRVRPWLEAGLLFPLFWVAVSLLLFMLVEFGFLQNPSLEPLYDSQLYTQSHPMSWTTLSFFTSAIVEELFFRAWLPDYLEQRFRKSSAIFISALCFAVAHGSLHFNALACCFYVLVALGLSYARTFHGLGTAIGLHLLNNLVTFSKEFWQFNIVHYLMDRPWGTQLATLWAVLGCLLVGNVLRKLIDRGSGDP